jgi:hypothetical protein
MARLIMEPIHDYTMPHDSRYAVDDPRCCPPNCPFRKHYGEGLFEVDASKRARAQVQWPSVPGSLIRAIAVDDSTPANYMLLAMDPDEPDGIPMWVHPERVDEPYRQQDLTLLAVLWWERR